MNVLIRLSPSQIAMADDCRFKHFLGSILRVKVAVMPANLAFGRCIDRCARDYLAAIALRQPAPEPAELFRELWRKIVRNTPLSYAATHTPQGYARMGMDLMRTLPEAWRETGFRVALDPSGKPLLDVALLVDIGQRGNIKVQLKGVLDVVVHTPQRELAVLDVKSSSVVHSVVYARRSDQLTAYQILLHTHRHRLQIPVLSKLGFWDLLKRKASSRIEPAVMVPTRRHEELVTFRDKMFWLAEDICHKRFPKVSRMQFNTPCEMCEFKRYCLDGVTEGLIFPSQTSVASA